MRFFSNSSLLICHSYVKFKLRRVKAFFNIMKNKVNILFPVLLFLSIGLFYFGQIKAEGQGVVFNEIAWMGNENSSSDEWIELKNIGNIDIDLTGWKIEAQDGSPLINLKGIILANDFYVLERSDDNSVSDVEADLIYFGAMGNDGETLNLYDGENNLVDEINCGNGWFAGDNETKQTMEKNENTWLTSIEIGGTPGRENIGSFVEDEIIDVITENIINNNIPAGVDNDIDINNREEALNVVDCKIGDILISEIVSDPADGEVEWVEIYNKTKKQVSLNGWTIEEGSGTKTTLDGLIDKFFILEKPKGNLNNSGDVIILKNEKGKLIDSLTYGEWDNGNSDSNADIAPDPNSLARKFTSQNTFNNKADFAVTEKITKGGENIIVSAAEDEEYLNSDDFDFNENVIISEVYPNPIGTDSEGEFIELMNNSESDVDLFRWRIGDDSKKEFIFKEKTILKIGEYLLLERKSTGVSLNNGGDSVKLFQPFQEKPLCSVEYKNAENGNSYNLDLNEGLWKWSEVITPGVNNVIKIENFPPEVSFDFPDEVSVGDPIIFDASDTSDYNGDELNFEWDFGDAITKNGINPQHAYWEPGVYMVVLKVSDGEFETVKEKQITVTSDVGGLIEEINFGNARIIISELLPNPVGGDEEGEWIEIQNKSDMDICLKNWQIDDGIGGSRPYKFLDEIYLKPDMFYVLDREESNIALNNSIDMVRVISPNEEIVDSVEYEKVKEGLVYVNNNNNWQWGDVATPGKNNLLFQNILSDIKKVGSVEKKVVKKNESSVIIQPQPLNSTDDFRVGEKTVFIGQVTSLPNLISGQFFYITGEDSVQVYSYNKDFPADIELGDVIEVEGIISSVNNEWRIKTHEEGDIKIMEKNKKEEYKEVKIVDLDSKSYGKLTLLNGLIAEIKESSIFIDDNTGDIELVLHDGLEINQNELEVGDEISVVGVLNNTKNGVRFYPRIKEDIFLKNKNIHEGEVLGKVVANDEWSLESRNKSKDFYLFLLILIIFTVIVSVLGFKYAKDKI